MSIFINPRANRLVVGAGVSRSKIEKALATTEAYSNIILMAPLNEVYQFAELAKNSASKNTPQIPLNNIKDHRDAVEWLLDRLDPMVTGSLYVLVDRINFPFWKITAIPKAQKIAPQLKIYML